MWYDLEAGMSMFTTVGIVMAVIGVGIIVISVIQWGMEE